MPEIDGLFTIVEEYESMTIEQLQVLYSYFFTTEFPFFFCLIFCLNLNLNLQ